MIKYSFEAEINFNDNAMRWLIFPIEKNIRFSLKIEDSINSFPAEFIIENPIYEIKQQIIIKVIISSENMTILKINNGTKFRIGISKINIGSGVVIRIPS